MKVINADIYNKKCNKLIFNEEKDSMLCNMAHLKYFLCPYKIIEYTHDKPYIILNYVEYILRIFKEIDENNYFK